MTFVLVNILSIISHAASRSYRCYELKSRNSGIHQTRTMFSIAKDQRDRQKFAGSGWNRFNKQCRHAVRVSKSAKFSESRPRQAARLTAKCVQCHILNGIVRQLSLPASDSE